jgi:signal transduction histidine kinase
VKRAEHFTVTQWFALIAGLLLLVATLGLLSGLLALGRLDDRRDLLVDRIDPANVAAARLSNALVNEETGVRGYVLSGEDTYLQPYRAGRAAAAAATTALARLQSPAELMASRDDLRAVEAAAEVWRREYADPAIAAVKAGREPPLAGTGKARFDTVRGALEDQSRGIAAARAAAADDLDDTAAFVTAMFVGAGLLVLFALVAAALTVRRVIVRPIARLGADVRAVAGGDFERPVKASGPREISALGADVETMRERIVAEVGALRDAERALIEQAGELQRSNEELEQFAYVASHDLQEPLRKVASFTQMLERRYRGQLDERADRYIEFAVDGAKRMQELINDLLEFSRVGRMSAPHGRVESGELVEQALGRLATPLRETGGEVIADGLPAVTGDAGLLTGVFQNLISNAIKFRGDGPPRIRFAAERDGDFWHFTCTDDGIGVDDEYGERIFVIFQRLHTRDVYEGTGIGLALCRKIIEYHGGRIWLAPAEAGRGARFEFTLPAADPEEETTA